MSTFDGTAKPLEYGQALAELAARVPWGSEEQRQEVTKAILQEHGLWQEPEPVLTEQEKAAKAKDDELAELRRQLAEKKAADEQRARDDELAELRRQLAETK